MIAAIGAGIGEDGNIEKRRYNKVVIMTDADVDGSHIRTLLLCFFYRQMYDLVRGKHVYVAQPPLFKITHKKQTHYVQTEAEMNALLTSTTMTKPMTTNAYHVASTCVSVKPVRCETARQAIRMLAATRITPSASADRCSALPWPY